MLELNNKTLLRNKPNTLATGHGIIMLRKTEKLSPCSVVFIVLGGTGGCWDRIVADSPAYLWTLHVKASICQARCACWDNSGIAVIVQTIVLKVRSTDGKSSLEL